MGRVGSVLFLDEGDHHRLGGSQEVGRLSRASTVDDAGGRLVAHQETPARPLVVDEALEEGRLHLPVIVTAELLSGRLDASERAELQGHAVGPAGGRDRP